MQAWASGLAAPRVPAASAAEQHYESMPEDKAPMPRRSKSVWAAFLTAFSTRRILVHPSQDEEFSMEVPACATGRPMSADRPSLSLPLPPPSWGSEDNKKSSLSAVPDYSFTTPRNTHSQSSLMAAGLSTLESKQSSPDFRCHKDLPSNSRVKPRQVQKTLEADSACKSRVTPQQLEKTIKELSDNMLSFDGDNFSFIRSLQEAPRNSGRVDYMEMLDGNFVRAVAVKGMPKSWTLRSHSEFWKRRPAETEQPWVDMGVVKELNRLQYQYACDFLGVFETNDKLLVITSLAEHGDLFSWIATEMRQTGHNRESRIQPIAVQLCDAVCWLHELGVAHRDISVENVVLAVSNETPELKLVDFGAAVAARHSQGAGYGKGPYRAPEMYTHCEYDAFLTDAFATAVVLLSTMLTSYPWQSTRPGGDPKFTKAVLVGMFNCLKSMNTSLPGGDVVALSQVASSAMMELLVGLLALQPCRRQTLGESCFGARFSVWDNPWLRGLRPNRGFRVGSSGATSISLPML